MTVSAGGSYPIASSHRGILETRPLASTTRSAANHSSLPFASSDGLRKRNDTPEIASPLTFVINSLTSQFSINRTLGMDDMRRRTVQSRRSRLKESALTPDLKLIFHPFGLSQAASELNSSSQAPAAISSSLSPGKRFAKTPSPRASRACR